MPDLEYRVRDNDFKDEEYVIKDELNAYANSAAGLSRMLSGCFCYEGGRMIGGVTAQITGTTLGVKLLWVDKEYRSRGVGAQLMSKMEEDARTKGCAVSFVDTMSYQAPGFYNKQGYVEDVRIADFYAGHDRIFFKKALV